MVILIQQFAQGLSVSFPKGVRLLESLRRFETMSLVELKFWQMNPSIYEFVEG